MDVTGYTTLARQSGLMTEIQVVANNVANASTTGFRREGVVFSEVVRRLDERGDSVSMAAGRAHLTDLLPGSVRQTGGSFDFAIEGDGFFLVETPDGQHLTRAGAFLPNQEGELVTPEGYRLLDAGGAPVFVPPDAGSVSLGEDGTLSADGRPLTQIGLWQPIDPIDLSREGGTRFSAENGVEPMIDGRVRQGMLEGSNVDPLTEVARMIEVQRAYELGQTFLDKEDERIRQVVRILGQ